MGSVTFEVNTVPVASNSLLYKHWRARQKEKDRWRMIMLAAASHIRHQIPKVLPRARILIEVWRTKLQDFDNRYASVKWLVDGMVACGLLHDDNPEWLPNGIVEEYLCDSVAVPRPMTRITIIYEEPDDGTSPVRTEQQLACDELSGERAAVSEGRKAGIAPLPGRRRPGGDGLPRGDGDGDQEADQGSDV